MDAIDQLPLTVIGALHGVVFGGGFELALACDLRIADQSTRFAFPELRLGLVPGWGGTYRLARETNVALLRDLLLTGRTLGAERAYQVGLVSQVVPRGEHKLAAQKMAEQCARFTRASIAAAKRLSKPLDRVALVVMMTGILLEADRVGNLDRHRPDPNADADIRQHRHHATMEFGHRHRFEGEFPLRAVRDPEQQRV
jgi:enoyl-CoA hydratase/carnithine racemase